MKGKREVFTILSCILVLLLLFPLPTQSMSPSEKHHTTYDYVIITPDFLKKSFLPLVEYKSKYLSATIITLDEIITNPQFWVNGTYGDAINTSQGNPWIVDGREVKNNFSLFNDTQAHIRNFIRYAYDHWNTRYVLFGGDHEILPSKRLYCEISNWTNSVKIKSIYASILSDHYFSALNGTWNDDSDQRFGEKKDCSLIDEADFTAEVLIGRAPVNDKNEVNVFINKVISYETSQKPPGVLLQQSYIKPSRKVNTIPVAESCAQWIPSEFEITRLYERNQPITSEMWIDTIENDSHFLIYQIGNGYNDGLYSWYQLSWDGAQREMFTVLDVGHMHNSFFPIHLSISCLTGDFSENECLAEELLFSQRGGISAYIGNSEVGCLDIADATKYSSEFFTQMFYQLFQRNANHLGEMVQQAKEHFIDMIPGDDSYRWCFYELNLLGDPEMPILGTREKQNTTMHIVYVDDDFTSDDELLNLTHFSSIQAAHDAIPEHGTIIVHPGIYKEHLIINKTVKIQGIDKTSTMITNKHERYPIISFHCHFTHLKNMTITCTHQSGETYPNPLVFIKENCNGNTIENTIIQGKASYGILVSDSIRNTIKQNHITDTRMGIALKNSMQGILSTKVIVTCDNIISQNHIQSNHQYGLYIDGSLHNFITGNVFLDNGNNTDADRIFSKDNHICLLRTRLNVIDGNYWGKAYEEPYTIWSLHGPITIFTVDVSKGLLFKYYKCLLILNLGVPIPVYDLHPLKQT